MPDPLPPLHQTYQEKQMGHLAFGNKDSSDWMEPPIRCPFYASTCT